MSKIEHKKTKIPKPVLPVIPDQLPPRFKKTVLSYAKVFDELIKSKVMRGATGDLGSSALFAFPPYHCVDITMYYRGSIPLAIGFFYLAGKRNVWALSGDYTFIPTGNLGLAEVVQHGIPLKVIIFTTVLQRRPAVSRSCPMCSKRLSAGTRILRGISV